MNRYTVLWDQDVEAAFIKAWVGSDSTVREILTEAANWIDSSLAIDPDQLGGEVKELGVRVIVVPTRATSAQIAAVYQVLPEDRVVRVVRLTFAN